MPPSLAANEREANVPFLFIVGLMEYIDDYTLRRRILEFEKKSFVGWVDTAYWRLMTGWEECSIIFFGGCRGRITIDVREEITLGMSCFLELVRSSLVYRETAYWCCCSTCWRTKLHRCLSERWHLLEHGSSDGVRYDRFGGGVERNEVEVASEEKHALSKLS